MPGSRACCVKEPLIDDEQHFAPLGDDDNISASPFFPALIVQWMVVDVHPKNCCVDTFKDRKPPATMFVRMMMIWPSFYLGARQDGASHRGTSYFVTVKWGHFTTSLSLEYIIIVATGRNALPHTFSISGLCGSSDPFRSFGSIESLFDWTINDPMPVQC